jgi:uncharacterized DUF497 family protein
MDAPTFEWDPAKAAASAQKHGVAFEEDITASQDPLATIHPDPDDSGASSARFWSVVLVSIGCCSCP